MPLPYGRACFASFLRRFHCCNEACLVRLSFYCWPLITGLLSYCAADRYGWSLLLAGLRKGLACFDARGPGRQLLIAGQVTTDAGAINSSPDAVHRKTSVIE